MASPTQTPAMPASASGVSNTRDGPNSSCRPSVTRNTPPSFPTSSPRTSVLGSSVSERRSASLIALAIVTSAIGVAIPLRLRRGQPQHLLPLPREVFGLLVEHPREQ